MLTRLDTAAMNLFLAELSHSPELNPTKRLWLHLRDNRQSHRVVRTTEEIVDSCCAAWNWLLGETGRIRSLCSYPRLARVST